MIILGKQKFVVPRPRHMRTFALQQRLFPIAGNLASVFVSLIGKTDLKKIKEADITASLPAALPQLGRVFAEMPNGEIDQLTRILLGDPKEGATPAECATMDDMPLWAGAGSIGGDPFDTFLAGRTWDTWKLLAHAMEVWYPDFFALVQPLLASVKKASPSVESSISPTNGPGAA